MDVRFEALTQRHCKAFAPTMQEMDRFEFKAQSGTDDMERLLLRALKWSKRARAFYVGDDLVCIYGVATKGLLSRKGIPWMAASYKINEPKIMRRFIQHTKQELAWLEDGFKELSNEMYVHNRKTIRWLKHIGFEFDPMTINVNGVPFFRFRKVAQDV